MSKDHNNIHNEFDEIFKDKMSQLNDSSHGSDWSDFSKILKEDPEFQDLSEEDSIFDAEIFKAVSTTARYNSDHWVLLKERLVKEASLKKHIVTIKSIELMLVLLLLLTSVNLSLYDRSDINNSKDLYASNSGLNEASSPLANEYNTLSNMAQSLIPTRITTSTPTRKVTKPTPLYASIKDDAPAIAKLAKDDYQTGIFAVSNSMNIGLDQVRNDLERIPTISPRLIKTSKDIQIETPYELSNYNSPALASKSINLNARYGSSLFFQSEGRGRDKVHITPDPNYGIEVLYGSRKGRFEFNTGLRYSSIHNDVRYNKDSYEEIDGNLYEVILQKQAYDVVTVPMYAKFHTSKDPNESSFFVTTGIDNNFIFRSDYDTRRVLIARASMATNSGRNEFINAPEKNFEAGIEQGGQFTDNIFMTANVGVGYQYRLGDKIALTSAIHYNKYLFFDGLGPNDDRYDVISAALGIKLDLAN